MANLDDSKLSEVFDREFADRMTGDHDPATCFLEEKAGMREGVD
jgi:hypothetical protein